jgi:hypothetical protein
VAGEAEDAAPAGGNDAVLCGVVQGRLRRPVARAARMRSSAQARSRWRSSAIGRSRVFVAKQVIRMPSASVILNWAPGWGRSLRTISRMPLGQPSRTSPASSATQALSRTPPSVSTAGVPADAGILRTWLWMASVITMPTE